MVAQQAAKISTLWFSKSPKLNKHNESYKNSKALIAVFKEISKARTANQAIVSALNSIKDQFDWAYGSFWKLDIGEQVLRFSEETGAVTPEFTKVTQQASFAKGVGFSGKTWQRGELMFVEDLGEMTDCCRREAAQKAGVKSGVCIPLYIDGQFIGTIDFFTTQTIHLSEERKEMLEMVGHIISETLTRLNDMADMKAITRVREALDNLTDFTTAPKVALQAVQDSFDWAYGSYWVLHPEENVLKFSVETGVVTPEFTKVTQQASFAKGVGLSGKTWQRGELMFVEDLGEMTDCCRREAAQKAGVKSGICFPIYVAGEFQGTMDFFATETLSLSEQRLKVLKNVGQMVSSTLEKYQIELKLEEERQTAVELQNNAEELSAFCEQLLGISQQIYADAHEGATMGEDCYQKSNEVSENILVVASSTEEMSATINEMSTQASSASNIANEAEIKSSEIKELVSDLGERANGITKVVDLIKDIAAQTNLLALNATIEAASAGEAGKGFAVVANEVKDLAKQSSDSSESIRQQIEEIQVSTKHVVGAINSISEIINNLNDINMTIAGAIEEQSAATNEISSNVIASSESVQDISKNVHQLADKSGKTSQSAQEVLNAVEQLKSMSNSLKNLIKA